MHRNKESFLPINTLRKHEFALSKHFNSPKHSPETYESPLWSPIPDLVFQCALFLPDQFWMVIPNQITLVTLHSKCNHSNNVECLFERSVLYSTMGGFWGFEIMGWVSSCVYVLTGMYASLPNSWRCLCTIIHNTYLQIFLQRLYLILHMHMHSAERVNRGSFLQRQLMIANHHVKKFVRKSQ